MSISTNKLTSGLCLGCLVALGILNFSGAKAKQATFESADAERTRIQAQVEVDQEQIEAEKNRLKAKTDLEAEKARQLKRTADAYDKNQVAPPPAQLFVTNYTKGSKPPTGIDWAATTDPTLKTMIYDKHRQCIGYAEHGQFYFVVDFPHACLKDDNQ